MTILVFTGDVHQYNNFLVQEGLNPNYFTPIFDDRGLIGRVDFLYIIWGEFWKNEAYNPQILKIKGGKEIVLKKSL